MNEFDNYEQTPNDFESLESILGGIDDDSDESIFSGIDDDSDDSIFSGLNNSQNSEFLKAIEEYNKIEAEKNEPYIQALTEKLNIEKDKALSLLYEINRKDYEPMEFVHFVEYFCNLFNGIDNFLAFVKAQAYIDTIFDIIGRRRTIFNIRPYTIFGQRMAFLQDFLNISKEKCVAFLIDNPSWMYHTEQYFEKRTQALEVFFEADRSVIINLYISFPAILGKKLDVLLEKIKTAASHFNVAEKKVKELMIQHPLLMKKGLYLYMDNQLGDEFFEKEWLIDCIRGQENCNFGGYRTWENMMLVIDKIETDIGEVTQVYNRQYKDGSFTALLVEKDNKKYLVSLGSNACTQKQIVKMSTKGPLQEKIEEVLGDMFKIKEWQEFHDHHEYVCQLNTEKKVRIDDILFLMAIISSHEKISDIEINPNARNIYNLSESDYIKKCDINVIKRLVNEEHNLFVGFNKIEPAGNGRIGIQKLNIIDKLSSVWRSQFCVIEKHPNTFRTSR